MDLCSKGCIYEVRGKLVFGLLIGLNIWGRIFGWGWDLYTTRRFNGQYIGRFIYQLVLKIVYFSWRACSTWSKLKSEMLLLLCCSPDLEILEMRIWMDKMNVGILFIRSKANGKLCSTVQIQVLYHQSTDCERNWTSFQWKIENAFNT